jgi:hypothetical protein
MSAPDGRWNDGPGLVQTHPAQAPPVTIPIRRKLLAASHLPGLLKPADARPTGFASTQLDRDQNSAGK